MDKVQKIDRRKLRRRTTKVDPGMTVPDGTMHSIPQQRHPMSVVLVVAKVGGIPLPTTLQHHMTIKRMQGAIPIMDLNALHKAKISMSFKSVAHRPTTVTITTSVLETIGIPHHEILIHPKVLGEVVDEDRPCQHG